MKKWLRALSTITLCICLCFCSISAEATSKDKVDELKQQVDDASNAVSDIKNQKKDAENKKSELQSEATSLTGKITDLNSQISKVTSEINDTEADIDEVEAEIELLNEEIEKTQNYLEIQRESMKLRIQYMYETRSTNQLVALLECGSIAELMARIEYMAQITTYDQNAIELYEQTQAQLEDVQALVEAKHEELVTYQNNLNNKVDKLGSLVSSTKNALDDTNTKIDQSSAAIADLEKKLKEAEAAEASIRQAYMAAQVEYAMSIAGETGSYSGGYQSTDDEVLLLAALIQAEAANQGDVGRLAVGSVVMNRVASSKFPNTIAGVIYQSNQFAPVASGRVALILAQGPNSACQFAAAQAMSGTINVDSLFFCTYSYAQKLHESQVAEGKTGFLDRTSGMVINAHYFYNYY